MRASIKAEKLGMLFLFDRNSRVVTPALARLRRRGSQVEGLKGVDFTIGAGDGVALLGPSGAGKTTLLRLLAGVLVADQGTLEIDGRVGTLLSVEAGLTPRLTGRENATLLGVLSGLSRSEAKANLDQVKIRSGLGQAFDRPVSSYSQGMQARLGYAVAATARPDILLLDEVHEAFDHEFRAVVERHARELIRDGGIVVAAGHDHDLLERMCPRALSVENGRIMADGPFADVRAAYLGPRGGMGHDGWRIEAGFNGTSQGSASRGALEDAWEGSRT